MQGPISLKNKMLSTPLLSKNSTPIRTRIISNQAPLNSTPINQLKISSTPINNKQNFNTSNISSHTRTTFESVKDSIDLKQFTQFGKTITFGDYKFSKKNVPQIQDNNHQVIQVQNISPILALNNKINQFQQSCSFSTKNLRSLTSNNNKRPEFILNQSKQKRPQFFQNSRSKYQDKKQSKQKSFKIDQEQLETIRTSKTLRQSSSINNLRSSSSFSNLFQKRSKTPTRLGSMAFNSLSSIPYNSQNATNLNSQGQISYSSISRKTNPSPRLNHQTSFKKQQSTKFRQRSTQQYNSTTNPIINLSTYNTSFIQNENLMCMNNHDKIAKYKVKQTEGYTEQILQNFVYCSKCAIELVQKGFSVEQLGNQHQTQSQYISPRQQPLRQSRSFKNSFLSFKTSYNSQMLEKLKTAENLTKIIGQEINKRQQQNVIMSRKLSQQMQQIDCYYNSILSYIEQQRAKDKATLQSLKPKLQQQLYYQDANQQGLPETTLINYLETLQQTLRNKNLNPETLTFISQVERQLQAINTNSNNYSKNKNLVEIVQDQQKRLFYFPSSIQDQFDEFVSYFDISGKLQYKTFEQINPIKTVTKNNPLRFSFQKALQNQNRKKSFILDSDLMNPLQQESEEEYDENSFSHQHMKQTAQSEQNYEQKPFRTLFAEEDDILQEDEQATAKNDMYSPTFKSI